MPDYPVIDELEPIDAIQSGHVALAAVLSALRDPEERGRALDSITSLVIGKT